MSGFEIAGLVLGAFPLLCEAGTQVGYACKSFKTWWRFERELEKFLWAVEREQIAFSQNLEIFLDPMKNLTTRDREILQAGLDSTLWHSPRVQKELRQGIQDAYYPWFIRQLVEINDALNQLHELLPTVKQHSSSTRVLESHIYKLRHSFFPRKDELLALITEKNQSIFMFFNRASLGPSRPHRPDKRKVKPFLDVQQQTLALHETLQSCWSCACDSGGNQIYAITTQGLYRESLRDPAYIRLLSSPRRGPQLRVEVEPIPGPMHLLPRGQDTKRTDFTALRQELTLKSKLKELKDKSAKGISVLATSAIMLTAPPVVENTQKEKKQKYRKLYGFRDRLRKRNDSLRVTSELPLYQAPRLDFELPPLAQVRFEDEQSPSPAQTTLAVATTKRDAVRITNFCDIFGDRSFDTESCQGFLQTEPKNRPPKSSSYRVLFHLDPTDQTALFSYIEQDLPTFIDTTSRRDACIRIGLSIILNILNLGKTPMIPTFYNHSNLEETIASDTKQARHALFTIGILLLELLFGNPLTEPRPASTNGDYTNTKLLCEALTWQRRAEEEFGDGIAEAIRKCIVCAFEPAADLGSPAFVTAVWANVVQPLEEFLKAWGGGSIDVDV
ncbi:hypothetical protein V8F20_005810 [Naviculisporaceae sp. PSN 640]